MTQQSSPDNFVSQALSIFWLIVIVVLIRGTVIEPFHIPSSSMVPTLLISDHILISKFAYGFRLPFFRQTVYPYATPKRGDVVVFFREDDINSPEDESENHYIKRVIGVPGDLVEVKSTDRKVLINNVPLSESYARWSSGGLPDGNFGPIEVPPGKLFVLGDNRDNSKDSRFWSNHFVDVKDVKGRALLIYWTWTNEFLQRFGRIIR
jgi:signal peptidase I